MRSLRCPKCGLTQMALDRCKRCGAALSGPPRTAPAPLNPYAPPTAEGELPPGVDGEGGVWRDGRVVVMEKVASLPDRCIKCNAPAEGYRMKRTLYWHPPAWYLLIIVGVLVYAIAAMIVRKKATVVVPMCPRHRSRRTTGILVGCALMLAGVGGCIVLSSQGNEGFGLGFLLTIVGLVWAAYASQVVTPAHIGDQYVRLKGASAEFLQSLPALGYLSRF